MCKKLMELRFRLLPTIQDFNDYREKVLNERVKGNLEPWLSAQLLATYFEGLGALVKKGLVDIVSPHASF
jgi:hypothetical protein